MRGTDYLGLEAELSEEQRSVRDSVRSFVEKEVLPELETHHQAGTFPRELVEPMARLGLFGANLKGYGCAGMDEIAYGLICQELERGDSGLRSFVSVQGALAMYAIYAYGDEAQKSRWLPGMAAGELIGSFGLTEPESGSDPASMRTRAVPDGDGYRLSGSKMWITNAGIGQLCIVWAKLEDDSDASPARKVRAFIVPLDAEGVTVSDIPGKLSLRVSVTSALAFDEVKLGPEALLPGTAGGLKHALGCLTQARYGIAWGAVGAAEACFDAALGYQQARQQFGRPLASFQLQQARFAEMLTAIVNARGMAHRLGKLKQDGQLRPEQVSLAKRHNVAAARDIARTAREMLGANGVTDGWPVMRHMMNLETVYTYEGTHDIHTLVVGKDITGLQAFV